MVPDRRLVTVNFVSGEAITFIDKVDIHPQIISTNSSYGIELLDNILHDSRIWPRNAVSDLIDDLELRPATIVIEYKYEDAHDYVGLTLKEAQMAAEKHGLKHRVVVDSTKPHIQDLERLHKDSRVSFWVRTDTDQGSMAVVYRAEFW